MYQHVLLALSVLKWICYLGVTVKYVYNYVFVFLICVVIFNRFSAFLHCYNIFCLIRLLLWGDKDIIADFFYLISAFYKNLTFGFWDHYAVMHNDVQRKQWWLKTVIIYRCDLYFVFVSALRGNFNM